MPNDPNSWVLQDPVEYAVVQAEARLRDPHPVIQTDVESEILRLCSELETRTEWIVKHARAAAEADVTYTMAFAKAVIQADERNAEARRAQAILACRDEYKARKYADAVVDSAKEAARNIRAQLDALRSINANVRAQL